jgi:transcriptional regulator with GAF, ATPase, and Fis domain
MKYPTIWYKDFTRHSQRSRDALLRSLAAIKACVKDHFVPSAPGLILLDTVETSDAVCALLEEAYQRHERTIVVIFDNDMYRSEVIWELLFAGASKVYDFENTALIHQVIEEQLNRWYTIEGLMQTDFVKENLIGESAVWKNTLREMIEIATYSESSVLIIGESGTGKEMLSRLVHFFDPRRPKGNIVLVDCTTISPELSGSEFFGHEKGAFTGAVSAREGAFALANNGTLFLDEIGELPLRLQAELLRVIQEGMYKPVGDNFWKKTAFRLVGATNRLLNEEVSNGRFRLDLYYRLSSWVCKVPSLEERREDIPLLAQRFFEKSFHKRDLPPVDASLIAYLTCRTYQGNVRELQQLIQRIANQHVGKSPITLADIPSLDRPERQSSIVSLPSSNDEYQNAIQKILERGLNLRELRDLTTQTAIELTLRREKGRVAQAANRLGITSRAIQFRKTRKQEE